MIMPTAAKRMYLTKEECELIEEFRRQRKFEEEEKRLQQERLEGFKLLIEACEKIQNAGGEIIYTGFCGDDHIKITPEQFTRNDGKTIGFYLKYAR